MTDPAARGAPLGATVHLGGVHFAVASSVAEAIDVCLLGEGVEERRVAMARGDGGIWRADVPGASAGQRYQFRANGPYEPDRGLWCDPNVALLDPYAKALDGAAPSSTDRRRRRPLSVVVDDAFEWGDDDAVRPRYGWDQTVLYELHVKGATMRHPSVPAASRGTYAGLAHESVLSHLVELGVTAVELLPVHEFIDEGFLVDLGLVNYWGYNPIGFFAPAVRYAATTERGGVVGEFKQMVRDLHAAGLEVILDVVYNHTAEGDVRGPVYSFRGLDAAAYYRKLDDGRFADTTGCGNSINAASDLAVHLMVDSLRYWVAECHVDGFRFDLAPTLARPDGTFDPAAPFLEACARDPLLGSTKLICEPWDVGCDDSFALGRFPAPFGEWNGKFRDTVRDFWRGKDGAIADLAARLAGSEDLFAPTGRSWRSSINFVTSHDGFTLADLVTFEEKHNEANGQHGADGANDNRSWNGGIEGPTDDPEVRELRARQRRALLATLLLSRGVPMLLGGDELGRTQGGNNNAFCQDNETSWLDWEGAEPELSSFVTRLLKLRRAHEALHGGAGDELSGTMSWSRPDGSSMESGDWQDPRSHCVTVRLQAKPTSEDDVVLFVNGHWGAVWCSPPDDGPDDFVEVLSTYDPARRAVPVARGEGIEVPPRSIVVVVRAATAWAS